MDNKKDINGVDEKNMNIPANEALPQEETAVAPVQPLTETPPAPERSTAPQIPIQEIPITGSAMPHLHPVHKKRMVLLMVITIILGVVSVISLLFALKMKGNTNFTFRFPVKEASEMIEVEIEKETEPVKRPGDFDPVDVVNDLDNLDLEDIEKSYLDSGLN